MNEIITSIVLSVLIGSIIYQIMKPRIKVVKKKRRPRRQWTEYTS